MRTGEGKGTEKQWKEGGTEKRHILFQNKTGNKRIKEKQNHDNIKKSNSILSHTF